MIIPHELHTDKPTWLFRMSFTPMRKQHLLLHHKIAFVHLLFQISCNHFLLGKKSEENILVHTILNSWKEYVATFVKIYSAIDGYSKNRRIYDRDLTSIPFRGQDRKLF